MLTLDGCRELVELVFRRRLGPDAAAPRVEDGRGRRHAAGSREVIKLPRWARRRCIVLHECAHGLARDGHGPDFVRAYLELLADFMDFDRLELEQSVRLGRLKATPAGLPIAAPAAPRARWPGVPRLLATRLLAVGIRSIAQMRALGPVPTWVRLKQKFGGLVTPGLLVELAILGSLPPGIPDGRTRARLKFEATAQWIASRQRELPARIS